MAKNEDIKRKARKKAAKLSDLPPTAAQAKGVKAGAVNAFVTFFDKPDGESVQRGKG